MEILEQRLRCHKSGTFAYSHTYGDHDDSRNPHSSQDCGSRWRWTGIRKLCSTTACSGGTQPFARPHGRERGGGGRRPGVGGWWQPEGGGARGTCVSPPPLGPLYIGGRGAPLPLHQGSQGRAAKERSRAAAALWGWGQAGPKP
jgi:hypothetical protein